MYAPCCLNSLARLGSTIDRRVVTFFALSRGTRAPQLLQEMKPDLPFPPFDRPLLFLFFDIIGREDELPLRVCYPRRRISYPETISQASQDTYTRRILDEYRQALRE